MSASPASLPVSRFPARIGQAIVAPRAAAARIEAEGGSLRDALWLVVLGVVTFRLPELCRVLLAIAGPATGGLMRVAGLFLDETREAAWVVLPAAVIVTAAAGTRRDATRDLDLGAACYAPYFALRSLHQALSGLIGTRVLPSTAVQVIAGAGAAVALVAALRTVRGRKPGEAQAAPSPSDWTPNARARGAGSAVVVVSLVATVAGAVWSARHLDALRPMHRGEAAPEFALPRIDGTPGALALEGLRGQVVVLDFWATWCPPCIAMLPVLDAAYRGWQPRGVAFVGINSDGGGATLDEIKSFLIEHPIPYPVVLDQGVVGSLYKVEALPTLVVLGRDGRIRKSFVGYTSRRAIDGALQDALDH
jgi:thiol-disulfide isomerase/thioredoxin